MTAGAPKSYGADTSVTELKFRSKALWFERTVKDASGELVALAGETAPLSRLPGRLEALGIDLANPLSGAEQGETHEVGATTTWSRTAYVYVSDWVRTAPALECQDTLVQRVDHTVRLAGGGLLPGVRVMQTAQPDEQYCPSLWRESWAFGGRRA